MNGASYEWSQRVADFDRANMKINERSGGPNVVIAATKEQIYADTLLMTLLREWHRNRNIPPADKGEFDDWLERLIGDVSKMFPKATPYAIRKLVGHTAIGVLHIGVWPGPTEVAIPADGDVKEE